MTIIKYVQVIVDLSQMTSLIKTTYLIDKNKQWPGLA